MKGVVLWHSRGSRGGGGPGGGSREKGTPFFGHYIYIYIYIYIIKFMLKTEFIDHI